MENKLSIVQEENLCGLVHQYPVIFDKSQRFRLYLVGFSHISVEKNIENPH